MTADLFVCDENSVCESQLCASERRTSQHHGDEWRRFCRRHSLWFHLQRPLHGNEAQLVYSQVGIGLHAVTRSS